MTGEDLTVFEEELIGLSCDVGRRDVTVAGEVLQPLDSGGKEIVVFIQSLGFETVKDLRTKGVEVDGIPLVKNTGEVPLCLGSGQEVVLTAHDRAQRKDTWIGGCN